MKRFFWKLFITGTVLLAFFYLLACLTPFISADCWVVMGYMGLGFPFLLAAMLLAAAVWCIFSRKATLLLLLVTALGSYHISHLFGWHRPPPFHLTKAPGTVRVMGWNIENFGFDSIPYKEPNAIRFQMMRYLRRQQPDILCIQDFTEINDPSIAPNLSLLSDSLQLPYFYYSNTYHEVSPWNSVSAGVAIFSRYQLHNARRILYNEKKWPEAIIQADVTINGITRRLIVTHLQSFYLKRQLPQDKKPYTRDEDSAINYSGSTIKKLNYYLPYHARQAQQLRQVIDDSPYPVIFSADMNEVPTAYCYNKIRGNLNDVFLQKGWGLGRTYYRLSPTLRIDYLFTTPGTEIVQYGKDTPPLSDHYPQMIDIKW